MVSLHYVVVVIGLALTPGCLAHPARETGNDTPREAAGEWSPKPTPAPRFLQRGAVQGNALFERQLDPAATCGYIAGNASQPVGCPSGFGCCFYSGGQPRNWACCANEDLVPTGFQTGNFVTGCKLYGDPENSNTGPAVIVEPSVLICPSARPSCVTTGLSSGGIQYNKYDCGTTYFFQSALATTTEDSTTTTMPTTTTAASSFSSSSTQSSSTTTDSTPTPIPDPNPNRANVGAIAGGVVGGVAALAIIGGIIAYLAWKKTQKKKGRRGPMLEMQPSRYGQ